MTRIVLILFCLALLPLTFEAPFAEAEKTVTCGWCNELQVGTGEWYHGFNDTSGDQCGFPNPYSGGTGNTYCARCGGSSSCHTLMSHGEGLCHISCGGDALAPYQTELEDLVEKGMVERLLVRLVELHDSLSVEARFLEASGRLDLVAQCDPDAVALTLAVPANLRAEFGKVEFGE